MEQTKLGWLHFLGGRVSQKWRALYCKIQTGTASQKSLLWTKNLILLLWNLSLDIWKYCNDKIHGRTNQEQPEIEKNQLVNTVRKLYGEYRNDLYLVAWNQSYVFERRSLVERIGGSRDQLRSWIDSVNGAVQAQQIFLRRQRLSSIRHFCTPWTQKPWPTWLPLYVYKLHVIMLKPNPF